MPVKVVSRSSRLLKVAMVLSDLREDHGLYDQASPLFGTAPTALLEGLAKEPNLEVHVVSCIRRRLPVPTQIAENIFLHSCYVPWWGWLKMLYLPCLLKVRSKARSIQADVAHGQGTERYCALAAVTSGLPSVLTIHGNMRAVAKAFGSKPLSFHGVTAWLESKTLPLSKGVICLNEYTSRQVGSLANKQWKVSNAVASEFFNTPRCTPEHLQLFCPALVNGHKNQNALIRALDSLSKKYQFKLTFAGPLPDTPYAQEFLQLIANREWCAYLGVLAGASLKAAYSRATAVVLPSLEDNCPMAILEAMAIGLPIAAARIGGIPELVTDGENGVLFDPRNPEDIASAIERMMASPQILPGMGRAARDRAEKDHNPHVVAKKHAEIYRSILASGLKNEL